MEGIKISEKALEDILFDNIQSEDGCENLKKRGLYINHYKHALTFRQFNLREYGIIDILRVYFHPFTPRSVNIEIFELKVDSFDINHLLQLGRYASGINHIIQEIGLNSFVFNITSYLIVNGFRTESDLVWMDQLLGKNVRMYSTDFNLDGLKFNYKLPQVGWRKTGVDVDINRMIDTSEFLEVYKNSYREFSNNPNEESFIF